MHAATASVTPATEESEETGFVATTADEPAVATFVVALAVAALNTESGPKRSHKARSSGVSCGRQRHVWHDKVRKV